MTQAVVQETRNEVRWCWRCRAWGPGKHRESDGRFDQWSVDVSNEQVEYAIKVSSTSPRFPRDRTVVRWNIAFGLHLGTYERPI